MSCDHSTCHSALPGHYSPSELVPASSEQQPSMQGHPHANAMRTWIAAMPLLKGNASGTIAQ